MLLKTSAINQWLLEDKMKHRISAIHMPPAGGKTYLSNMYPGLFVTLEEVHSSIFVKRTGSYGVDFMHALKHDSYGELSSIFMKAVGSRVLLTELLADDAPDLINIRNHYTYGLEYTVHLGQVERQDLATDTTNVLDLVCRVEHQRKKKHLRAGEFLSIFDDTGVLDEQ